eukprot:TRINITY_DN2451_c0_g1_i2.p1 TRINITY_DN2451_c0_g1~~TRINITY_DN2451_c0_g1_i2.p1  ORF type:complete len:284 (+),score=56.87 TRINITY_DN2451_c0_g1_i2:83-934(+)
MLSKLVVLAGLTLIAAASPVEDLLAGDDECSGADKECSLNALQLNGKAQAGGEGQGHVLEGEEEASQLASPVEVFLIDDDLVEHQVDLDNASSFEDPGFELDDDDMADAKIQADYGYDASSTKLSRGGWGGGGDKVWGAGRGVESISGRNVHYYDSGMYAARARCGGSGCALIINPPGHRTINRIHIHFVHYHGYGASLKKKLESKVCGRGGWHGGGLPCGGKAAFFHGFPGVFSKAMSGGNIHHASVIAWPASCGGRGTIIELAYGCSIEHQIRGDFNPRRR